MTAKRPTDGNFRIVLPTKTLAFTGERMTTAVQGQIEFEHFHRYCLARDLCAGLDVLDVASGEGYGSAILASVARSVTGVEIDPGAIAHARAVYSFENLCFLEGSALSLPLEAASVDIAISFETVEHIREHEDFVAEIRRVLRPGGLFIVSSPDRTVYSARHEHVNEYHLRELTEAEFDAFLNLNFKNAALFHQRALLGSIVVAASCPTHWRSYERRTSDYIEASNGLTRAPYIIGFASDAELPDISSSVYIDRRSVEEVLQGSAEYERERDEAMRERDEALASRINAAIRANERECERDELRFAAEERIAQLLEENKSFLLKLDRMSRRPWRPFKQFFQYSMLKLLSIAVRPFSQHTSQRFKRSAAKRNPWRYKERYNDICEIGPPDGPQLSQR